ncbi:MAG: hypothetical protein ACOYNC_00320 [Bacteroidales bacterium]
MNTNKITEKRSVNIRHIFGNGPPFARRWHICRYGLWRMHVKPVPIGTTPFRRT